MAIIKQGILGGFSGKVGTVVGSYWKGRYIIRAVASHVTNPQTDEQKKYRQRFSLVGHFVGQIYEAVKYGFWPLVTDQMTAQNYAVKYNLTRVITGTYPDQTIDYTKVVISCGALISGDTIKTTCADSMFSVSWTDNTGVENAQSDDIVAVAVYNTIKAEGITSATGKLTRKSGGVVINIPARWSGDNIVAYITFTRADHSFSSDSIYLGSFTA